MVEKIQLAVAAHFQSIEQQQAAEAAQPAEIEEQPGEAEQLTSEEAAPAEAASEQAVSEAAAPAEAAPEDSASEKLDAAAEQHIEVNQETSPNAAPDPAEVSSGEPSAPEDQTVEQKEKSTGE